MQRFVKSPAASALDVFVGEWTLEVPNPPGGLPPARGTASFEWMKDGVVLVERSPMEGPLFPDLVAFLGADAATGQLVAHYWDSGGGVREWNVRFEDGVYRQWHDLTEGESAAERITLTLSDDGATMAGPFETAHDGATFEHAFDLVMRRAGGP